MALLSVDSRNTMLDHFADRVDTAGLLRGTDEADELSGGEYARQPVTFDPAADGQLRTRGDLVFEIPEGQVTIRRIGFWGHDGTYRGSWALSRARDIDGPAVHRVRSAVLDLENDDAGA